MRHARTNRNSNAIFEPLENRQMMAAGDLDPTFGAGGRMISQTVGFPVADIAVQSNGAIVAVGHRNGDFAVARVNPNGTIDKSFGGNNSINTGIARADFGGDRGDFAKAVAIQADGKIVVGGHMDDTSFTTLADVGGFVVARFNKDGSLDKTFDGDGKVAIDMPGVDASFVSAIAIQKDGKIVAAGTAGTRGRFAPPGNSDDFAVARLLPNGSLDNTFGNRVGGILPNGRRTGRTTIGLGSGLDSATAIALAPDGKILVGGTTTRTSRDIRHVGIARLTASGDQDQSFGDGGEAIQAVRGINVLSDIAVAPDGKVTAVANGDEGNFALVRFNSNGKIDNTLNGNGIVITDLGGNDRANSVRINSDGILVGGSSNGQFALARFRQNGALDQTFGQGGKVFTAFGGNASILATSFTADGKILAFGKRGDGSILSARYVAVLPKVNVFSLDPSGSEAGGNNASLIFTRDVRASFPTRIFFDLGGTASIAADYTGPSITRIFTGGTTTPSGFLTPVTMNRVGFVDIPANQTTAIVPINVIDDKALEPAETVRASIRANSAYTLGDRPTQQLDIADNDIARVNFQVTPSPHAFAYEPDLGLTFGTRSNGQQFGWDVDNKANARDRGFAAAPGMSMIYTTFNHMQKPVGARKWELAVPNGLYTVKLAAGDPKQLDSVYKMNLEGQLALSGTPSGLTRWFESTVNVQVSDGRLTLSNAAGAKNNKIAFIEIRAAAPGAAAGAITANVPVRLPLIPLTTGQLPGGGTIFSQLKI
jgi:uncharacterized delta-60 repeat protein